MFNITDYVPPETDKEQEEDQSEGQEQSEPSHDQDHLDEAELDAEFEEEQTKHKKKKTGAMDEEDDSSEFEFPGKQPHQDDEIKNELEKVKPRLAIFRCVGIGLKNHSREMA